jgi:hypothetical protein
MVRLSLLRSGLVLLGLVVAREQGLAQVVDKSAENLMVVLRESTGLNKQDEVLDDHWSVYQPARTP